MKTNGLTLLMLLLSLQPALAGTTPTKAPGGGSTPARIGAGTIALTTPGAGSSLEMGAVTPVGWKYSGISPLARVQLLLFKGGTQMGVIATDVPITAPPMQPGFGALSAKWKAGVCLASSAQPDCGYRIQVVVMGASALNDFSDAPFCITKPVKKSLKLSTPVSGENWLLGSTQRISWTCAGCQGPLRVNLFKGGQPWGRIASPDAASGFMEWKVGVMPPPHNTHEFVAADDYRITIQSGNNELKDENTPLFSISMPTQPGRITRPPERWLKVTSPLGGAVWQRTKEFDITWQMSGSMTKEFARIVLLKNGQEVFEIEDHRPLQQEVHRWTLPAADTLPEGGGYQIRIRCIKFPEVSADSGVFQLASAKKFSSPVFPANTGKGRYTFKSDGNKQASEYSVPPGDASIGYANVCQGSNHQSHVYRSVFRFDLNGTTGVVKWAKFSYQKLGGTGDGPSRLCELKLPWNGTASDMWTTPCAEIDPLDPAAMRALVQKWIEDPHSNFGLLMTGPEKIACNNDSNLMRLGNVSLSVGIETIE